MLNVCVAMNFMVLGQEMDEAVEKCLYKIAPFILPIHFWVPKGDAGKRSKTPIISTPELQATNKRRRNSGQISKTTISTLELQANAALVGV